MKIALSAAERADAAAVTILRRLLETIEVNLPGTLADIDSEYLHDLRVAVRRSRALQRELRGVFPPEPLRVFRDEFRELQVLTGPTRDLDVQLLEFGDLTSALPAGEAADVAPLRTLLEARLADERATMVRGLQSERTAALLGNWSAFLDALVAAPEDDRPDAARPVADVAGERIGKVYRRMVKMGARDRRRQPARGAARPAQEGQGAALPARVLRVAVSARGRQADGRTLKGLQDVLGRFQDREVQADSLRALGDEIAVAEGGAAALMAMGVLVQRLLAEQDAARAEFDESFALFAAKPQRKLVEATFG